MRVSGKDKTVSVENVEDVAKVFQSILAAQDEIDQAQVELVALGALNQVNIQAREVLSTGCYRGSSKYHRRTQPPEWCR